MNPVRGIETLAPSKIGDTPFLPFQINESRSRDWNLAWARASLPVAACFQINESRSRDWNAIRMRSLR